MKLCEESIFQCLETTVVERVPFEIRELELVQSDLLPDGPKHTVLGTVRLQ
jgi:2'-5' RNA ligase